MALLGRQGPRLLQSKRRRKAEANMAEGEARHITSRRASMWIASELTVPPLAPTCIGVLVPFRVTVATTHFPENPKRDGLCMSAPHQGHERNLIRGRGDPVTQNWLG